MGYGPATVKAIALDEAAKVELHVKVAPQLQLSTGRIASQSRGQFFRSAYFFVRRKLNPTTPNRKMAEEVGSGTAVKSTASEAGFPPSRDPMRIALLTSEEEIRNPKFCVGSSTIAWTAVVKFAVLLNEDVPTEVIETLFKTGAKNVPPGVDQFELPNSASFQVASPADAAAPWLPVWLPSPQSVLMRNNSKLPPVLPI